MKKIINENDPRVIKTRRLLLDSFVVLVNPGFDRRSVKTVKTTPETRLYQ
jgi:hypothetical protein